MSYGTGTVNMVPLQRRMDSTAMSGKQRSIHFLKKCGRPIGGADCEAMLPPTFHEGAGLLLTRPRAGERPRFTSRHDSNTIIRSWHRSRPSDGERAEHSVGAGRSADTAWHTGTDTEQHRGVHGHMDMDKYAT